MEPAIWTALYAELPLHEALRTLHGHGWNAFEASTEHLVEIETLCEPETAIEQALLCLQELGLTMPQAHALLQADVAAVDAEQRRVSGAFECTRRYRRPTRGARGRDSPGRPPGSDDAGRARSDSGA